MNEWKELEIENLPNDIWKLNQYEFYWRSNGEKYVFTIISEIARKDILKAFADSGYEDKNGLIYRKPEPKQPTHEEIMTKWWFNESRCDKIWQKVESYSPDDSNGVPMYWIFKEWKMKRWFIGKESADTPPEGE